MSTPDNTATWRDLADQLTPQQVAELEYCEREGIPPGMAEPGTSWTAPGRWPGTTSFRGCAPTSRHPLTLPGR